jgi:hypothetical protein
MNMKLFFLLFSLLSWEIVECQTYVSGGIYSNTNWTKENSPYIVTGDVILFPGYTLTINPGVNVQFYDSTIFEVRGTILSNGTREDSISFVSISSNPTKGVWRGIIIDVTLPSRAEFRFVLLKDAELGIYFQPAEFDTLFIKNCKFDNNIQAVSGYGGDVLPTYIDSCYFIHNDKAITFADKTITNSTFVYNNYGLYEVERIGVYNSYFCGNQVALCGSGLLKNNLVMNNTVGVKGGHYSLFDFSDGNIIAKNDTGVIISGLYGNSIGPTNIICDNTFYDIVNANSLNFSAINNCFCLNDSSSIENKIYDGYDNPQLGLIDFIPFINCSSSIVPDTTYCPEIPLGVIPEITNKTSKIIVYPNPFDDYTNLEFTRSNAENVDLFVYNSIGQLLVVIDDIINGKVKVNRNNLPGGVYYFQLKSDKRILGTGKFILE